jgi:UDP-N-acetylmuramoyl-tripeptide--D-alanyl-D-alanine ligase
MNAVAGLAAVSAALGRPLLRNDLAAVSRALATVQPVPGRLATSEVSDVIVIDDSYNANPRSVRVAIAAARETADGLRTRLIVALGDMLELGSLSHVMHVEAVRDLYRARPDACVAVGPEIAAAVHEVGADDVARPSVVELAGDSIAAASIVRDLIRPGDVLLVKGSRGIAMERIIDGLASV